MPDHRRRADIAARLVRNPTLLAIGPRVRLSIPHARVDRRRINDIDMTVPKENVQRIEVSRSRVHLPVVAWRWVVRVVIGDMGDARSVIQDIDFLRIVLEEAISLVVHPVAKLVLEIVRAPIGRFDFFLHTSARTWILIRDGHCFGV